jgi:hypothetical protein
LKLSGAYATKNEGTALQTDIYATAVAVCALVIDFENNRFISQMNVVQQD